MRRDSLELANGCRGRRSDSNSGNSGDGVSVNYNLKYYVEYKVINIKIIVNRIKI